MTFLFRQLNIMIHVNFRLFHLSEYDLLNFNHLVILALLAIIIKMDYYCQVFYKHLNNFQFIPHFLNSVLIPS